MDGGRGRHYNDFAQRVERRLFHPPHARLSPPFKEIRPMISHRSCCFYVVFLVGIQVGAAVAGQPGENVALGKKYTMSPAPNYPLCTDPGDAVQLTDGKMTKDYFWTQRGNRRLAGRAVCCYYH
jgi:hypothetical protein